MFGVIVRYLFVFLYLFTHVALSSLLRRETSSSCLFNRVRPYYKYSRTILLNQCQINSYKPL